MQKKDAYNVAVVGATGAVGTQIIKQLADRNFPVADVKLLSSKRSAGESLVFNGRSITVQEATPEQFEGVDIALFSAGGSVSKVLAPEAVARGALVIDNTNAFRMEPNVPLVVPEVNAEDALTNQGIIANPNCSTIQMVVALKPLHERYGIERIIVSTYQAVSGAGQKAVNELARQSKAAIEGEAFEPDVLPVSSLPKHYPIAFNAIPQIDVFQENGFTLEEMKMVRETQKILHAPEVKVTVTCVRIPVFYGHSEAVYVELQKPYELSDVKELLANAPGVVLKDDLAEQSYPMTIEAAGKREVFVGRVRRDLFHARGLNLWVVSDNLLKGAAWNAVQIAEYIIGKEV